MGRAEELRLLMATVASGLVTLPYEGDFSHEDLVDVAFDIAQMIFERVRAWVAEG